MRLLALPLLTALGLLRALARRLSLLAGRRLLPPLRIRPFAALRVLLLLCLAGLALQLLDRTIEAIHLVAQRLRSAQLIGKPSSVGILRPAGRAETLGDLVERLGHVFALPRRLAGSHPGDGAACSSLPLP